MFCPGCGQSNQTANAYCTSCGDWVPETKRRSSGFGGETPLQNIFTGMFFSALSVVVALFSAIALYATYLGTPEAKWSVYLAAGFCLCIAGWQLSSFIVALKLRNRLNRAREGREVNPQVKEAVTSPALPPADLSAFVRAPSVTENTTELLQPVDRPKGDGSRTSRG